LSTPPRCPRRQHNTQTNITTLATLPQSPHCLSHHQAHAVNTVNTVNTVNRPIVPHCPRSVKFIFSTLPTQPTCHCSRCKQVHSTTVPYCSRSFEAKFIHVRQAHAPTVNRPTLPRCPRLNQAHVVRAADTSNRPILPHFLNPRRARRQHNRQAPSSNTLFAPMKPTSSTPTLSSQHGQQAHSTTLSTPPIQSTGTQYHVVHAPSSKRCPSRQHTHITRLSTPS
jgi:hypothetical protein